MHSPLQLFIGSSVPRLRVESSNPRDAAAVYEPWSPSKQILVMLSGKEGGIISHSRPA